MNGLVLLLATATVGVEYGWRPLADGQLEYLIQLNAETLQELEEGEGELSVGSLIPREVRGVRRIRILFGTGPLPREGAAPANPEPRDVERPIDGSGVGEQPNAEQPGTLRPPLDDATGIERIHHESPSMSDMPDPDDPQQHEKANGSAEPPRPWLWLSVALVGLVVSVGLNFYQGWITLGMRRRYHRMVDRLHTAGT